MRSKDSTLLRVDYRLRSCLATERFLIPWDQIWQRINRVPDSQEEASAQLRLLLGTVLWRVGDKAMAQRRYLSASVFQPRTRTEPQMAAAMITITEREFLLLKTGRRHYSLCSSEPWTVSEWPIQQYGDLLWSRMRLYSHHLSSL